MMAVQLHNELNGEGFIVVPLHPGELSIREYLVLSYFCLTSFP